MKGRISQRISSLLLRFEISKYLLEPGKLSERRINWIDSEVPGSTPGWDTQKFFELIDRFIVFTAVGVNLGHDHDHLRPSPVAVVDRHHLLGFFAGLNRLFELSSAGVNQTHIGHYIPIGGLYPSQLC